MARERLSSHAKARNKERFGVSNKVIKEIMRSGYTIDKFEGPFHDFLNTTKSKGTGGVTVKVKGDILVVYNKRSRRAITTYKIPDKYLPIERYFVGNYFKWKDMVTDLASCMIRIGGV